jgi:hypothetical protein
MRITRAALPVAAIALAAAAPAFAAGGWLAPTTVQQAAPVGQPLPLAQLPVDLGYVWAQAPASAATSQVPLTLAQLPLLTTYPWAQPGTAHEQVPAAEPWSL